LSLASHLDCRAANNPLNSLTGIYEREKAAPRRKSKDPSDDVSHRSLSGRELQQSFNQSQARSKSKWSWQCYPYCDGGTYEGRPVREWMKPDRW
jgi:hypothetical protein